MSKVQIFTMQLSTEDLVFLHDSLSLRFNLLQEWFERSMAKGNIEDATNASKQLHYCHTLTMRINEELLKAQDD